MKSPIRTSLIARLTNNARSFGLVCGRPKGLQASFAGTGGSTANPLKIFDRSSKLKQKSRALRKDADKTRITQYLRDEVSFGLVDRLRDIRKKYDQIVEFGAGYGSLVKPLLDFYLPQKIILTDSSRDLLWRDSDFDPSDVEISRLVMDEELVTLEPESQECIMSCLSLHWVNDLPGTLIQIQRSLKPDGVFIGAMVGGDTLFELRTSLQLAEQEREGGISARVSPMTDSQSMSSLINRAGFSIPTIDVDEITVQYPGMLELMDDLRSMGESNATLNRRTFLKRDTLLAASSIYESMYGTKNEETGETVIPATFQIIYFIGWRPDANQPKPLKRGSAQQNLKDVLEYVNGKWLLCEANEYPIGYIVSSARERTTLLHYPHEAQFMRLPVLLNNNAV